MPELRFRELPSPSSPETPTSQSLSFSPSHNNTLPRSGHSTTNSSAKKRGKPCAATNSVPFLISSSTITSTTTPAMATTTSGISNSTFSQRSFVRQCPRARRIRFFRNGDQYFKGVWYAISAERFRSFEALLEDLNRSVLGGDLVNLPHGVRCIFTVDGQKITQLDELLEGESYVCASNDSFKKIDYENAREPIWSYSLPKHSRMDGCVFLMSPGTANANLAGNLSTNSSGNNCENLSRSGGGMLSNVDNNDFVYPKIITVVRNGVKPRRAVRLLLNKRTARSFQHVLSEITTMIKLDCGMVKKLFTLTGKQVTSLCDFFHNDDVFIACGSEKMSVDDFYLDSEEYKCLWSPKLRPQLANFLKNDLISSSKPPPFPRRIMAENGTIMNNGSTFSPGSSRPRPYVTFGGIASSSFASVAYPLEIEERFEIGNIIGDGNFAVVRKCICKRTKEPIALKIIDKAKCVGKEEMVENEVQLLRRFDHPHIVKLLDFRDISDRFYLAIEFMPRGDLFDALVSARYYSENEAAQMMSSLASALEYLHNFNVVHRDVKPENLLVYEDQDGSKKLKLTDFGLAAEVKNDLFTVCGTPTYVAPEILAETGYGLKVDIWAAGVIMYIMLCGFPPFVSMSNNQEELFQTILSGHYEFPRPYWNHISNAAKGLIQGMLQLDADDRYSASEVLIHPWITSESQVDQDFEQLSLLANQAAAEQRGRLEAGEYFRSRRRSMDDLSTTSADGGSTFSKDNTDFGPTESSG